ncbi:AAA family ATPase [Novosphingobium sp. JCM 18896]|uniref:AAA family ATPase n=1 Tax=Novosphingobium sp. JCM 18896 TaxID=2989731 RepID=UPI0022238288|nr:AAA family ATPase [Novosphingobium sp. JCM 18896]MCW1428127.1 AAA family ATPase [Novosphingobium sp. JCM 18896]
MTDHLFVITGGPGSGKTTLVAAVATAGLATMAEAGRAIIRDQVAIGGSALPWADRSAFAELMLSWDLRSHREACLLPGPVICDRGLPDVIGYLTLCGLPVPAHLHRAAEMFRYNRKVFVAPHWPEIYARDEERRQDEAEAAATCEAMIAVYQALGYETIMLPLAGVPQRREFVLGHLAAQPRNE